MPGYRAHAAFVHQALGSAFGLSLVDAIDTDECGVGFRVVSVNLAGLQVARGTEMPSDL